MRLVERDRSGVRTTAAGTALLRPAREVLQAERNARMAVAELAGLLKGSLVVGGSTIPASYVLPGLVARFHAEHPGVTLQVVTGDSREMIERVRDADVEVAVVGSAPAGDDLESAPYGEDRLQLIVAPDHPLAGRRAVLPEDLLAHPLVVREAGSGTRAATEGALRSLVGGAKLAIACEVGSTEAQKAAVRVGLGAAFVSNLAVEEDLARGVLATATVKGFDVRRSFHLVGRSDALLSPAARTFRELARAQG